jgi:guanylate kinase
MLHSEHIYYHPDLADMLFIVLSGPSAGGKTALSTNVCQSIINLSLLVKHTNRQPRENERDGIDYHFCTDSEFTMIINEASAVVSVERYGNLYGLTRREIDDSLRQEKRPVFVLDPNAAIKYKETYKNSIIVWVAPNDIEETVSRIMDRKDSLEEKMKRIELLESEYLLREKFDIELNSMYPIEHILNNLSDALSVKLKTEVVDKGNFDD